MIFICLPTAIMCNKWNKKCYEEKVKGRIENQVRVISSSVELVEHMKMLQWMYCKRLSILMNKDATWKYL